ncbi:cation:dicarboxylate symporter family transporter, partial [Shewanella indica]
MAFTPTKKMGLTGKILIGMAAGIIVGLLLRAFFPAGELDSPQVQQDPYFIFVRDYITEGFLNVVGTIFISSLKMLVVPLVFISLVCGTSSLSDPSKLGR